MLGLSELLGVIKRWLWLIILVVTLTGALAYGVSLLLPESYSASADLIYRTDDLGIGLVDAPDTRDHSIAADAWVVETRALAERVADSLGSAWSSEELLSMIEVESDEELQLLVVHANAANSGEAARIANAFAESFVEIREEEKRREVVQAREVLTGRLESLTEEQRAGERGGALEARLEELLVLEVLPLADYELAEPAVPSDQPSSPRPVRNGAVGIALGIVLGLGGAFALEYTNRRLNTLELVEEELGLPVLASVPSLGNWGGATQRQTGGWF